jgi:DNA replication protein DnaC
MEIVNSNSQIERNKKLDEVFEEIRKLEPEYRTSVCEIHGEYQEKGIFFYRPEPKWLGCDECKRIASAEAEAKAKLRKQIEDQERVERRLNQAGIPIRFRDRTLDNYVADTREKLSSLTIARDFVENFDDNYKNGMTLIFSGKAGTGKSHLAIAIAQAVMPKYTALYINALDAIRMIRDTWRKDSEQSETQVLDMLGSIGLLVIDEVGVQYGTENEQMLMFDIINRRYRDSMPMILLTNLGTDGFKEYLTERSYDRLRENGKWVSFDWESYRGKSKAA